MHDRKMYVRNAVKNETKAANTVEDRISCIEKITGRLMPGQIVGNTSVRFIGGD
jgi:hypothetical protein